MIAKFYNKATYKKLIYCMFTLFLCFTIITASFSVLTVTANNDFERVLFFKMPIGGNVKISKLSPHSLKMGNNTEITAWISYEHLFYEDKLTVDIFKNIIAIPMQLTVAAFMLNTINNKTSSKLFHMLN